ncbi:MAG: Hit-like protein involved in cell-cycle regulation, partial [Parcubacteria group bacterium Athens0416_74]
SSPWRSKLPSFKVFEDEKSLAFLDIHPVHAGHVLVIPKMHAATIFDVPPEDWAAVQENVRKCAIAIEKSMGADGVNLLMNNREHAGQVVHHAHVHLIPRFKGDGLNRWPSRPYEEGEADEVRKKILSAL